MLEVDENATWIDIWFTEGAAKCVHDSGLVIILKNILMDRHFGMVELLCIDGARIYVRSTYIQGYYINRPDARKQRFEWEKVLSKAEERIKKDDWD